MATTKKTAKKPQNLIIQNTIITQLQRQEIDIDRWRSSIRAAESITNPNRTQLYDIYTDIELDSHLTSVMTKRKAAVLKKQVTYMRNGKIDENIMRQIKSPWFHRFINDVLDSLFWEYSLFQFYRQGEWINYDLIPRKHVKPEKGIIVRNQNDAEGLPYRNNEFPNTLEVKYYEHLGLLLKATPWVIYKRNCMGDFAQFAEIFGQPMREGIYDGFDDSARIKLESDLIAAASSSVFVHAQGTSVNTIDTTTKSASTDIYNKLIEICNTELSKLILGNTLTTQQGPNGARSLGDVHKLEEEILNINDEQFLSDVLNYDMADIFANLGMNTSGGEFMVQEPTTIDLEKRINVDTKVADRVPVPDDYFYETYGIPKPDNYDALKQKMDEAQAAALAAGIKPVDQTPPNNGDQGLKNKGFFSFFA